LTALDAHALDALYQSPALTNPTTRTSWLNAHKGALRTLTDPWMRLALALEPLQQQHHDRDLAYDGAMSRLLPVWMDAELAFRPGTTYPDANNTLRLSFGTVQGYAPRDGMHYLPQTTVAGMVAKSASGLYDPPPDAFLAAAKQSAKSPYVDPKLGDVPLDFLTDLDSTGGNSGSATLNAKGELVGLLFDGNYESMAADWLFDESTTRSVHLDIRYLLFVLDSNPSTRWVEQELVAAQ
jgi:hypothetical protein